MFLKKRRSTMTEYNAIERILQTEGKNVGMSKILVSACLLGENCKYNGGNNYNEKLVGFLKDKEVIPVCPERDGGLLSPRKSVELIHNLPYDKDGKCYEEAFQKGIATALRAVEAEAIDYAVLQSRSPTCGVGRVYDGSFSGTLTAGDGRLVQALKACGIPVYDVAEFVKESEKHG